MEQYTCCVCFMIVRQYPDFGACLRLCLLPIYWLTLFYFFNTSVLYQI